MKMEPAESFVVDRSLRGLSHALRHPATWPHGFAFDYRWEKFCAVGLAYRLGMILAPIGFTAMDAFGLSSDEARSLFYADDEAPTTPEAIADRIDAYLARKGP